MFIKICGTTSLEDAQLALAQGADALGFIFAPSRRQVHVSQVAEISEKLPGTVEKVGVFTEPDAAAISSAVRAAGLTVVQMHWNHNDHQTLEVRRAVGPGTQLWQVVGYEVGSESVDLAESAFATRLNASALDREIDAVLLDSIKGGRSGGLGQPFPWLRAAELWRSAKSWWEEQPTRQDRPFPRVLVAGGLTPENVAEAVASLVPWGVDVVSGVEAGPGKKSPEKLERFVRTVRGLQSGTGSENDS